MRHNTTNLKQLTGKDAILAGGKGASLGEMMNAQIPVPPGFVVLAPAFKKFIEEIYAHNIIQIDKNPEMAQRFIMSKKLPEDLAEEIFLNFDELGVKYVAVRSSATSEDSKLDSWAGQFESYLRVDRSGLLNAVQKCWSSLFAPRAIFYRSERKLQKNEISMAVIIQKMVNSEVSGVCFTVHPVVKDRNQMIIEACWGLGEDLVHGKVTPDSYVVLKSTLDVVGASIEGKRKLSEAQIKELAKICIGIEQHYKNPCDIEWAFEGGVFYIVQSRPITTL